MFKKIIIPIIILILAVVLLILLYPPSLKNNSITDEEASDLNIVPFSHEVVEEYFKNNISALSSEEAVLGGTWYVTSVEFLSDYTANIYYEDGHIARKFFVSFSYDKSSGIIINELIPISDEFENSEEESFSVGNDILPEEEMVFCTMDAKMCPDGSYVGRVAPDCEFAPCP